ncbi:MAG TPA: hypothetical protein VGR65_09235, partial [Casimicrobiaceae bacterium]|nr:hypothetical protein [Casimicrobiaceae bacterium]
MQGADRFGEAPRIDVRRRGRGDLSRTRSDAIFGSPTIDKRIEDVPPIEALVPGAAIGEVPRCLQRCAAFIFAGSRFRSGEEIFDGWIVHS